MAADPPALYLAVVKTVHLVGFWTGLLAFIFTASYVIIQLLQVAGLIHYPLDEILVYCSSLCIVIPFMLQMLSLHYSVPAEKKFWSHGALLFTILYAVFVTANYVVQLATVIPMKLKGDISIQVLEQTPHSMFWDYDAIGYICMGLAMLMAVPVFEKSGFSKYTRLTLLANGLVTPLITIVYFYPVYSEKLLMLGFSWGITAPLAMLMLALWFRKQ